MSEWQPEHRRQKRLIVWWGVLPMVGVALSLLSAPLATDSIDRLPTDERSEARRIVNTSTTCTLLSYVSEYHRDGDHWTFRCGYTAFGLFSSEGSASCGDGELATTGWRESESGGDCPG